MGLVGPIHRFEPKPHVHLCHPIDGDHSPPSVSERSWKHAQQLWSWTSHKLLAETVSCCDFDPGQADLNPAQNDLDLMQSSAAAGRSNVKSDLYYVCVCLGRLCSCQDVLPTRPPSQSWFQTSEGKPCQAGPTGEETDRGCVDWCQWHDTVGQTPPIKTVE